MRDIARTLLATSCLAIAMASAPAHGATVPGTPGPSSLLLTPADLPTGYVTDGALENADATARSSAYRALIVASAFAGYRAAHAGVVHYVARLRDRASVALLLAREVDAVSRERGAARITLSGHYGDAATLAYQQRGARGEEWVLVVFGDGPFVTTLGAFDGAGEQAAIDLLQHLAPVVDARLRAAARQATTPTVTPSHVPPLALTSLQTRTRQGRPTDLFRPRSAVYWRAMWQVGTLPRGARETLRDWVRRGKTLLYSNRVTDRPFGGDNTVIDHLQLHSAAPGRYSVTMTITIGRRSVRTTHDFWVAAAPTQHTSSS